MNLQPAFELAYISSVFASRYTLCYNIALGTFRDDLGMTLRLLQIFKLCTALMP